MMQQTTIGRPNEEFSIKLSATLKNSNYVALIAIASQLNITFHESFSLREFLEQLPLTISHLLEKSNLIQTKVQHSIEVQDFEKETQTNLQIEVKELKRTMVSMKRQNPIVKKSWNELGSTGRSARRRKARLLIKELETLFQGSVIELAKCFNKDNLLHLVEISSQGHLEDNLREKILKEIHNSIPIDAVVELKETGNIADYTYNLLVQLSPLLRKILPKPWHVILQRRNLDNNLMLFFPQETKDGISKIFN